MASTSSSPSEFAFNLFNAINKGREKENFVISPLGIQMILGLTLMGAVGATKDEIARVLKISNNRNEAGEYFSKVLRQYKDSQSLSIACKVYVQEGKKLNSNFMQIAKKNFDSSAENIDFNQQSKAASTINSFVESRTNKQIQKIIEPSGLEPSTVVLLVNAVYFKGIWKAQFTKDQTKKADFWINDKESVKVDMMKLDRTYLPFGVFDEFDATAVRLQFVSGDLAMIIILPNKRTGLAALEEKLNTISVSKLKKKMTEVELDLSMPKFTIEFGADMNNVLQKMGIVQMFTDQADFTELLETKDPVKVSKVVHKAHIEVNEKGAEASAATGVQIEPRSMPKPARKFSVDHPFIYMVTDHDQVAFLGKKVR